MGEIAKSSWKKKTCFFNFAWPCEIFAQSCEMKRNGLWLQHTKGKVKTDFAWPYEIFAQSCEMLQEDKISVDAFSTSHNCANLLGLVRNRIFSRFLGEEASRRPLRWCQVSTWPWPINRNLINSFKDFFIFPNCKTFQISSFHIIL